MSIQERRQRNTTNTHPIELNAPTSQNCHTEEKAISETAASEDKPQENKISLGVFEITAYCNCTKCVGIWSPHHERNRYNGDFESRTASGTIPTAGRTIAADVNILPFGTQIYIQGLGVRVVEDTGSAVVGKVLDLFKECHTNALQWGRRNREVWIIYGR